MMRFIFLVLFSVHSLSWAWDDKAWLAFGEMRGYFEPCGCNPETDMGGMLRIASFLQRERALAPDLMLWNLGNNLAIDSKSYKNPLIIEGVERIRPTASLINQLEYEFTKENPTTFQNSHYVLSNRKSGRRVVHFKDTSVLGYLSHPELLKADEVLWKQWITLKPKKNKVLLFAGSDEELKFFQDKNYFQSIIVASKKPLDALVGHEEKQNPALLMRSGGVRSVPIGGQGMLRGGKLIGQSAPSIRDLLKPAKPCDDIFSCPPQDVTWLDRSYEVGSPLVDLEKKYNLAAKKSFQSGIEQRKKDLGSSPFVGSQACQSCHPQAYEVYQKSAHAHALLTLEKKAKDQDPECLSCHVLGLVEKGGFVSKKDSPQFANVQCETCHGPRKEHIQNPMVKPISSPKEVCVQCHHNPHSSFFVFEAYWKKIEHGK